MICAEITCAINAAGALQTFYFADERFCTSPSDTPSNTFFDTSIMDPGALGIHTFSDGRTGGATKLESGDFILANTDGHLDALINYSFDGRPIIIRSGTPGAAYPSTFTTIFTGTIESFEASWDTVILRLKDKQFVFTLPLLTTVYAGNNSAPNGFEGTVSDIKGHVKPRTYGKVSSITPVIVNTSKLTYQISDGAVNSIDAVYDKGAALTPGADYATSALLQAASPSAGTFITCIAEGYLRLGSSPVGTITVDVTQGANAAARTVAQIIKSMALSAGLSSGEISASDVAAMDALNSSVVGIYINDNSDYQSNMDQLLNSVGGYMGFDYTGTLRMGILTAPTGVPVVTIHEYDIQDTSGPKRTVPKDQGIPLYRLTLNHSKIYTPATTDLAGAVTDATRAILALQFRAAKVEDLTIKNQWKLAGEYIQDTLLTNATDATNEATRQLAIFKVRRDIFEFPISADIFKGAGLKLMDVISLVSPRFGMSAGKSFRLIGYRFALSTNSVYLTIWG